jgi:hypothetical protein
MMGGKKESGVARINKHVADMIRANLSVFLLPSPLAIWVPFRHCGSFYSVHLMVRTTRLFNLALRHLEKACQSEFNENGISSFQRFCIQGWFWFKCLVDPKDAGV